MKEKNINYNNQIPLYQQVKDVLTNKISKKIWKSGDLIPTEQELIDEFKVSRTTIRKAISEMVQENLLKKQQGRGTTVNNHVFISSLRSLTGFAEEVIGKGYLTSSKLISAEDRKDLYTEKKILQLSENESVTLIKRIRFVEDNPVALERTSWPNEIGKILQKQDLNNAKYYQILEKYGFYLKKANETISAVNATPYEAELLGITGGEALLEMTRVSYGFDDKPIEYTKTKFRSDRYHYNVELKR